MFSTYVLYNALCHKVYIGQTGNLDQRLAAHNSKAGKHYTAQFEGEWKVIYQESFSTRSEALKREKQLKSSRGRAHITQYIPGSNQDIPG